MISKKIVLRIIEPLLLIIVAVVVTACIIPLAQQRQLLVDSFSWKPEHSSSKKQRQRRLLNHRRCTTTTLLSTGETAVPPKGYRYLSSIEGMINHSKNPVPVASYYSSSVALLRLSSSLSSSLESSSADDDDDEEEEEEGTTRTARTTKTTKYRNHLIIDQVVDVDSSNSDLNNNHFPLRNRFFALRHGQSKANVEGLIVSDPKIARYQYGLSDLGKEQAKIAANHLISTYLNINNDSNNNPEGIAIVSSDLLRAKETARIVADTITNYNNNNKNNSRIIPLYYEEEANNSSIDYVSIDVRLRERYFGDWDEKSDVHYDDVWKDDKIDPYHEIRNVESVWNVTDRVTDCVLYWDRKLKTKTYDNKNNNGSSKSSFWWIIMVAHGDVLQLLQTAFQNMDPSEHRSVKHLETATLRPLSFSKHEMK